MLEELRNLTKVLADIKTAIDQDATQALDGLFKTYGQYAQMLCAEGHHRHLADKQLSLMSINLKCRQRLIQQGNGDKPSLSDATMRLLIGQVPLDAQLTLQVMKAYPACTGQLAEQIFINPGWMAQQFDDVNSVPEEIIALLVKHDPVITQGIVTRVFELIDPQMVGVQFVKTMFKALPSLSPIDSEFRAAFGAKQKLVISTLNYMLESGGGAKASIELIATVRELCVPELVKVLLRSEHLKKFHENEQEHLTKLLDRDLPFDSEALAYCIQVDQGAGNKEQSFATALYLANPHLSIYDLSEAMVSTWTNWRANNGTPEASLQVIAKTANLLQTLGVYDKTRCSALLEDLFAQMQADPRTQARAGALFAKHLPKELLLASSLVEHPEVARELLEFDLGL
ncbi:hypothetical protein DV532_27420 (plasmid) [Pseudomonas sp. Leaf58]|uniref:hypothetical protein n=1 Tax=Pseudomonas sp. Leaf58 TaxID=1736226 RepID=UPI0006FBD37E|nr:hypothetical protein [Pseudomonas sp. Leaf58]AYG48014.1 hypothetical protein DV532_27420 [Pseudomonas sp. Leaf58]KQN62428.1 hypothetical protein ASF02_09775 [Pseudomonas sp. Leaf58]